MNFCAAHQSGTASSDIVQSHNYNRAVRCLRNGPELDRHQHEKRREADLRFRTKHV